jgi:CHAT domain-containing protein
MSGAWLAIAGIASGQEAARENAFARCDALFSEKPEVYASSRCYYEIALERESWEEAAARVEELVAEWPENHWLKLVLGHLERSRDPERVEEWYVRAAEGFQAEGHAEGEVTARSNYLNILEQQGRTAEAEREIDRTVQVAESSSDSLLVARAMTLRAGHLMLTGGDLGYAYRSLRRAEQAAFPDGPYPLRRDVLMELGNVCFEMGRLEEALGHYRRLEILTQEARNRFSEAMVKYNIANTLFETTRSMPLPGAREEVVRMAEGALRLASSAGHRSAEILTHRLLAELLIHDDREEALSHSRRCVELAREGDQKREISHCLWTEARLLTSTSPVRARQLIDEALAVAAESGQNWPVVYVSRQRMHTSWETGPREQAIADSLAALDAIEAVRDLQDTAAAAGMFSAWTPDYYWLSGRLLEAPAREDLERAFVIAERMRARVLLEALTRTRGAPSLERSHDLVKSRRRALEEIVVSQKRLLDPRLTPGERTRTLEELERFEIEEEELRVRMRRASAAFDMEQPEFPALREVEQSLRPDEALLSFQVALWKDLFGEFGGGSWLLLITRDGTEVIPIPDRVALTPIVPLFAGLIERRDGSEAAPAAKLYDDLLAPALERLPDGVRRLIIVPDDVLHHVPFAALRDPDGKPLASRYELSLTPSTTLWLRWRTGALEPEARPGLALADPVLPNQSDHAAVERAWPVASGIQLGALPHARREARAIRRYLGPESHLLIGDDAAESFLKTADLTRFGVLHLAAHAVVDEQNPDRSAVLLSAGAASEDGLLQVREISELRLGASLVTLSACRTASGAVLSGEGVLGLARAFFQAGAHAVVGSLWPLRDDDAARIFSDFNVGIGQGESVAAALRRAQVEALQDGLPASAWAGLVVLGDGSLTPLPGGRPSTLSGTVLIAIGLGAIGIAGALLLRRRSRRPEST